MRRVLAIGVCACFVGLAIVTWIDGDHNVSVATALLAAANYLLLI